MAKETRIWIEDFEDEFFGAPAGGDQQNQSIIEEEDRKFEEFSRNVRKKRAPITEGLSEFVGFEMMAQKRKMFDLMSVEANLLMKRRGTRKSAHLTDSKLFSTARTVENLQKTWSQSSRFRVKDRQLADAWKMRFESVWDENLEQEYQKRIHGKFEELKMLMN